MFSHYGVAVTVNTWVVFPLEAIVSSFICIMFHLSSTFIHFKVGYFLILNNSHLLYFVFYYH